MASHQERKTGRQDACVQCAQPKATIRKSQQKKDPIFCASVDYWGETEAEWDRHKFTWTQADADALAAESTYWEAIAAEAAR